MFVRVVVIVFIVVFIVIIVVVYIWLESCGGGVRFVELLSVVVTLGTFSDFFDRWMVLFTMPAAYPGHAREGSGIGGPSAQQFAYDGKPDSRNQYACEVLVGKGPDECGHENETDCERCLVPASPPPRCSRPIGWLAGLPLPFPTPNRGSAQPGDLEDFGQSHHAPTPRRRHRRPLIADTRPAVVGLVHHPPFPPLSLLTGGSVRASPVRGHPSDGIAVACVVVIEGTETGPQRSRSTANGRASTTPLRSRIPPGPCFGSALAGEMTYLRTRLETDD